MLGTRTHPHTHTTHYTLQNKFQVLFVLRVNVRPAATMRRDVVQGARSVLSVDGRRDLPVHRRLSRSDQMGAPQLVVMGDSIFQIDFEICYVRPDLGFQQWYFWYSAIGLLVIHMIRYLSVLMNS